MKTITVGTRESIIDALHMVLDIEPEGVIITFGSIVEDIIITSPQGDVYLSWTLRLDQEWNDNACLLLKAQDNMKEFNDVNCTHLALKPVDKSTVRVYLTVQNN